MGSTAKRNIRDGIDFPDTFHRDSLKALQRNEQRGSELRTLLLITACGYSRHYIKSLHIAASWVGIMR